MRPLALVAALALSACTIAIDEASVFRPEPQAERAETPEQLARWPLAQLRAVVPDAEAQHGFLGAGDARIAYTLVTKPENDTRPLILYCGGNNGDRNRSGVYYALKALPYGDVLLFDYPGYGDSPGAPSAETFEAMAPLMSSLAADLSEDRPLVLWGHSLGGFICSRIARDTPSADGLILETTARNAQEVGDAWRPWYAKPFVRLKINESLATFDIAEMLRAFEGPVLILGAGRDDTLPVGLSRRLSDALRTTSARVTYVELPRANHVDVTRQPEFPEAAQSFFASVAGNDR